MEDKEFLCPGIIDGVGIVKITEKESNTPHFDIIRDDGSKVSIMIQDTKYFTNDGVLTKDEIIKFNNWIKAPSDALCGMGSNWKNIIFCWYGLYGIDFEWDWNLGIPDYSIIKPCDR